MQILLALVNNCMVKAKFYRKLLFLPPYPEMHFKFIFNFHFFRGGGLKALTEGEFMHILWSVKPLGV